MTAKPKIDEPPLAPWDGRPTRRGIWLRFIGPAAILVGVCLAFANVTLGLAIAFVGFVVSLIAFIAWFAPQEILVQDLGHGFRVGKGENGREYLDEHVLGISYHWEQSNVVAVQYWLRHYLCLWIDGETTPLEIKSTLWPGAKDPLDGLIHRLFKKSFARAQEAIQCGLQVSGDGWTLDRTHLTLAGKPVPLAIPLTELSSILIVDNQFCIWRQGQDEAAARLSLMSRNVHLLGLLLEARNPAIKQKPEKGASRLGRILFERRQDRWVNAALWASGPAVLIFGIGAMINRSDDLMVGIVPIMIVPLLLGVAYHGYITSFRCHERGVSKRDIFRTDELLYDELAAFSFGDTQVFVHPANQISSTPRYLHTIFRLGFYPRPELGKQQIHWKAKFPDVDHSLEMLRDTASQLIAARMWDELKRSGQVPWVYNLAITSEGVLYRPYGKKGAMTLLSFKQYGGYSLHDGTFYLLEKGNPVSLVVEATDQPNFYPGLMLLFSVLRDKGIT